MTIPQLKRMFESYLDLMVENLHFAEKNLKEKTITRKDIRFWKKEFKRTEKLLWIIENEPSRVITNLNGEIQ